MLRIPGIRRLFRAPELSSVEPEVDDELRFHFEMRISGARRPAAARDEPPPTPAADAVRDVAAP